MSNQVIISVTDGLVPENNATIDKGAMTGNAVSKEQYKKDSEAFRSEVKDMVQSNFKGSISPTSPAPTEDGSYKPEVSSELDKPADPNSSVDWGEKYPNAGNLRAKSGYDTMFFKKGTVWTKSEVLMPKVNVAEKFDDSNTTEAQAAKQISDWKKVQDFSLGFRKTGNLFDKNDVKEGYYLDTNGDEQVNSAFLYSGFINISPNTEYTQNASQIRNFYDENFKWISGHAGQALWTSPANAQYVRLVMQIVYKDSFILSEGNVQVTFADRSDANLEGVLNPVYKQIIHEDTSYNSIRTLADKLFLSANFYNRYEILVAEGNYTECDWKGWGEFVRIKGMNRNNCVIHFDGNSSNVLPSDYSFSQYSGQAANTVPQSAKHIVFVSRDIHLENLTLSAEYCKYPIHADSSGFKNATFVNCWMKEKSCNYPVGIGTWGKQTLTFSECIFEREHWHLKRHGIIWHNNTAQEFGTKTEFLNCKFIQCGYALVNENGSNQEDVLNILNCESDSVREIEYGVSQDSDGKTFWVNPVTHVKEADPRNVPYNIKLNTTGTKVDLIEDSSAFTGFSGSRPVFFRYVVSDYIGVANVPNNSPAITTGDLICSHGDADHNTAPRVKKFESTTSDLPYIGVALENAIAGNNLYYVPRGKYVRVRVSGPVSNAAGLKLVYDNSVKAFVSSPSQDIRSIDALAFITKTSTGIDLLMGKLI